LLRAVYSDVFGTVKARDGIATGVYDPLFAMRERAGLLLLNLGTPDAPTVPAVRRYLREFLSDPRVLDLPAWKRFLLLELVILPRRPRASAEAYSKIWTAEGSPLLVHGRALRERLRERLGEGVVVELGMRYGRPSIAEAVERLVVAGVRPPVTVLPLFAQQSEAATGSAVARVREVAGERGVALEVVPPFFAHRAYLEAREASIRPFLVESFDRILFTFHGLPERQVRRADSSGRHCFERPDCCAAIGDANRGCYRAQCLATARELARRLELAPDSWTACFQSRLGREPWLAPYTDQVLAEAARAGARRALVVPSFVADCLETLEELGIRGREIWREHGGEELVLVPALNSGERWVEALIEIAADGSPAFARAVRGSA
jgi:ferrochelatase